ncbi:MAG TPA: hypothetical protein PLR90_07845 [Methylophilus sp.]|nr:hypothetical protein [Methylophilus sp.]
MTKENLGFNIVLKFQKPAGKASMPLSLKLPKIDSNPILLAETRSHKIESFIGNLPFGDPIRAATDLIEELQNLNSQKVAYSNRLNALELYRPAGLQVFQDLIPHFSNASLPISRNELAFADAASQLWQEFALGYKSALMDLQNKILNINSTKSTALVVQRAIHAIKEQMLVGYLTYKSTNEDIWNELHQLYFCAAHQNADLLTLPDNAQPTNESSVGLVYTQACLMALANPSHLSGADILKTNGYLNRTAHLAELRALGLIDNPAGVFLIKLDSKSPPIPFSKNQAVPNPDTDILLVTVNLARTIHGHIKALQGGTSLEGNLLPSDATQDNLDLLTQLIKHFGKPPLRVFNRSKKTDGVELNVGIPAAFHGISKDTGASHPAGYPNSQRASRWQVLNASAGGYSLRKFNSSVAAVHVGDIVTIKNLKAMQWEVAVVRWANINDLNQLDIGLQLISPSVSAVTINTVKGGIEEEALLLPELGALKQPSTLILSAGANAGDTIRMVCNGKESKLVLTKTMERTSMFTRFQYDLI